MLVVSKHSMLICAFIYLECMLGTGFTGLVQRTITHSKLASLGS
jgi:hypothetical protein